MSRLRAIRSGSLFFLLLLLSSTFSFSQHTEKSKLSNVTKATFFNPGISYETVVGKFQTLYAQAFLSTSFGIGFSSSLGNTFYFHVDPAFTLQYRYYYNFKNREDKGKRTTMNSLNYICPLFEIDYSKKEISDQYSRETTRHVINTVGLAWGIQRNFKKRFSVDFNFGGGYVFGKTTVQINGGQVESKQIGDFTSLGQINLGFWLNKKK